MAASSSATFFGLKEEELKNHLNLQHSSGGGPDSIMASSASEAPLQRKKRNQPGTPSPDSEVIALSPDTLMATNRFVCEVCNKGFQREQNLQLHRRGHNLPWKLKQKTNQDVRKKVYLCPEPNCVHHDPSRALGDLTGIKKHFSRKHGEKKFRCEKCNKKYAVQSDWKAHSKTCGTREYKCECGTTFSRRDSFVTHRAFCDALAQETARQTRIPASLSNMAATIYAHASGARNSLGLTGPLISADHQDVPSSSPVFGLGAPAATTRTSFTGLLSAGQSVGSAFRPIQSLTMPIQPPEPKHNFQRFPDFPGLQGFSNNTTSSGPMFNLGFNGEADVDSPHNEVDLNMNSPGLFTGLMMNADPPVYNTIHPPQLSATALLQKAALMGSTSNSSALMKSLGSSSSSGVMFSNYGGIFGAGTSGGGRASSTFQEMYPTVNNNNNNVGSSNYGYGGGMELSEMNNVYGGVMYNVKNDHDGMELDDRENNVAVEPQMSVQSGYCDKLTRDFLGMGKRITSFSGEMEDDHKGNGTGSNSPDSEATTSAEPNPFVRTGHCGF